MPKASSNQVPVNEAEIETATEIETTTEVQTQATQAIDPRYGKFQIDPEDVKLSDQETTPWLQIISPPNIPSNMMQTLEKANSLKMGLFIQLEQAEKVGFTPDQRWEQYTHPFDDGKSPTEGYFSSNPRFVIIRSSNLGLQVKEADARLGKERWVFKGVAYQQGTALTVEAEETKTRKATWHLMVFVDENNNPLHETPLRLTAPGGFGVALSEEKAHLFQETAWTISESLGLKGEKRLDGLTMARVIFDLKMGYYRPADPQKAPFLTPVARRVPFSRELEKRYELSEIGGKVTQVRNVQNGAGRKIELELAYPDQLFVDPKSEAGKAIQKWYEESEGTIVLPGETDALVQLTGEIADDPAPQEVEKGYTISFHTAGVTHECFLPKDLAWCLNEMGKELKITGKNSQSGQLQIQSAEFANMQAEPPAGLDLSNLPEY